MPLQEILAKYRTQGAALPSINQAFRRAAAHGCVGDLQGLLTHGAAIDSQDDRNKLTALHQAWAHQKIDTIRFLLAQGANPYIQSQNGQSVYSAAINTDDSALIHLLYNDFYPKKYGVGSPFETGLAFAAQYPLFKNSQCKKLFDAPAPTTQPEHALFEEKIAKFVRARAQKGEFFELCFVIGILFRAGDLALLYRCVLSKGPTSGKNAFDFLFEEFNRYLKTAATSHEDSYFSRSLPVEYQNFQNQYLMCAAILRLLIASRLTTTPLRPETRALMQSHPAAQEAFAFYEKLFDTPGGQVFFVLVPFLINNIAGAAQQHSPMFMRDVLVACNAATGTITSWLQIKITMEKEYSRLFEMKKGQVISVALVACGLANEIVPLITLANHYGVLLNILALDIDANRIRYAKEVNQVATSSNPRHTIKFVCADATIVTNFPRRYDIICLAHPEMCFENVFGPIIQKTIPAISHEHSIVSFSTYWYSEYQKVEKLVATTSLADHASITTKEFFPPIHQLGLPPNDDATIKFYPPRSFTRTTYADVVLKPEDKGSSVARPKR